LPVGGAHYCLRQLPHRRDLAVSQAGIEQARMDGRQFSRVIDVSCELSGARPCRHRFRGAVPKAAPQRTAICDLKMEPVHSPAWLIRQPISDGNSLAEI